MSAAAVTKRAVNPCRIVDLSRFGGQITSEFRGPVAEGTVLPTEPAGQANADPCGPAPGRWHVLHRRGARPWQRVMCGPARRDQTPWRADPEGIPGCPHGSQSPSRAAMSRLIRRAVDEVFALVAKAHGHGLDSVLVLHSHGGQERNLAIPGTNGGVVPEVSGALNRDGDDVQTIERRCRALFGSGPPFRFEPRLDRLRP